MPQRTQSHREQRCRSSSVTLCSLWQDRKSTRLNSSHTVISYAVFCLKKKKTDAAHILAHGQCEVEVELNDMPADHRVHGKAVDLNQFNRFQQVVGEWLHSIM